MSKTRECFQPKHLREVMTMRRRGFLKAIATAAVTGLFFGTRPWTLPSRCVEAVRANVYPGPRKRMTPEEIAKPGKWLG